MNRKITVWFDNLDLYFRRWKRYDSYQTRKKLFLILIILILLFLWKSPGFFKLARQQTSFYLSSNKRCVEQGINEIFIGKHYFDYSIKRGYEYDYASNSKKFLPYVGNGKIGLPISTTGKHPFYAKNKRTLSLKMPYYPTINVDLTDADYQHASFIEFETGVAHRLTCMTLNANKQSVNIREKFYAHRLIPSLFVQEIKINNPTSQPLTLLFKRKGLKEDKNIDTENIIINSMTKHDYIFHSGLLPKEDSNDLIMFSIAAPVIPDFVEVRPQNSVNLIFYTFVNYTEASGKTNLASNLSKLKLDLKNTAITTLSPRIKKDVYSTHVDTWKSLWKSGFSISLSKAENVLNGDVINATIYLVLSQQKYSNEISNYKSLDDLKKINSLIDKPASCYDEHSTLQASSLWSDLETLEQINKVVNIWLLTLDKQGCHNLIASGAEGTLQAIILSFVPLQFTQHHVEFKTHPKDLHRDYFIRRFRFSKGVYLNLTIKVSEEDNRASIFVAIDTQDDRSVDLLACDAGCLDNPIKLNTMYSNFPVKLTEPITPILYITSDNQHIKDLKHTIHVKEISLAPAYEDHVIAMHKHGHKLGTLAALFWLTVVFLIVMFHVFLARIIYNEYFMGNYSTASYEKFKTLVK